MHLSVGDVASAREFYVDRLGFETTADVRRPGALRLGRRLPPPHGDEHLEQRAAPAAASLALGLGKVEIVVPSADDLGELGERMSHYGVATRDDGRTLAFDDPWSNLVEVRAADTAESRVSGRAPHATRRA